MNSHTLLVQMKNMLGNLDRWLVKATEHAKQKNFDPNVFASARLAPDQYPLSKQVQAACDAAKLAAARISGKQAPVHADVEQTIEELRGRITKATSFIDTLDPNDFVGCDERKVPLPFMGPSKGTLGADYLTQFAVPNFFFHLTTAYAILRHNGVNLGKADYIGPNLSLIDL